MVKRLLTCPRIGHLVEVEFEQDAATGRILGVIGCSRFTPREGVPCDVVCAHRLNRRLEKQDPRTGRLDSVCPEQ